MFSQILPIARNAFLESVRQPIVLFLVLLSGIFQILTTWNAGYSLGYTTQESAEVRADDKILLDVGLSTVFVIGALLAAFVATSVISREIDNKTVLTVISKPISRVSVILGKYLGVVGTVLISAIIMIAFLLMAVRHGVMSTAADEVDKPVVIFALLSVILSLGVAAWFNYFYGWNFPQTALLLLLPLAIVAYLCIMLVGKKWVFQDLHTDFKPQILTACACLLMAVLVLCAVATAASTRLGQVMTIIVCLGVFVAALLSNFFLGKRVFRNEAIGIVGQVEQLDPSRSFVDDHAPLRITGEGVFSTTPARGSAVYYGPNPNGYPLVSGSDYANLRGDVSDPNVLFGEGTPPAIIATESDNQHITIRTIGSRTLPIGREPRKGDYLFLTPTRVNYAYLSAWGALPNLQYFWLLDAVSQNRRVPPQYLASAAAYSVFQIGAMLSLAVILFQRRDVG
jgi:ABC-type transport system involved in multi-copper enzyme maturation permease subunit